MSKVKGKPIIEPDTKDKKGDHKIIVGIPVALEKADVVFNVYRHVSTGNPVKVLIAELMKQGVQIEECSVSMKNHQWGNGDLLPGVQVNNGAVGRLIQLVQEGYVQIQP
ncbi:MAG: DsrE family protein [Bacteroidetes bacterium]|nr:DsrE family protein [Bacteroidota bacterium]MCL6103361.1 DsrE family protein [Bacteroidota bacterium]